MNITEYTIYGERCSGTNFIEKLLSKNFTQQIVWDYGWKHFWGHEKERVTPNPYKKEYTEAGNVLFICIYRNVHTWLNSLFQHRHHLRIRDTEFHLELKERNITLVDYFLNHSFWSTISPSGKGEERLDDRNIYTGMRYKNIFEARYVKNIWLKTELPKLVPHVIYFRYEDLLDDYNIIARACDAGLTLKNKGTGIEPVHNRIYPPGVNFSKYTEHWKNQIDVDTIINNPNFSLDNEREIGYNML